MRGGLSPAGLRVARLVQIAAGVCVLGVFAALLLAVAPTLIGYESFVASNDEMQPTLRAGDLAVVQPMRADHLNGGDMITYRMPDAPDALVTRRVVSMTMDDKSQLQLQVTAAANTDSEPITVQPKAMLGRVVYAVPKIGAVVTLANSWPGKALLVGLPMLLIGVDRLCSRTRRRKRVPALVSLGRRALKAGHPQLALRAAEGALYLNAHSRAAWILKQQALTALKAHSEHASL